MRATAEVMEKGDRISEIAGEKIEPTGFKGFLDYGICGEGNGYS